MTTCDAQDAPEDFRLALDYLRGLLRDAGGTTATCFVHEGVPVPKARARWSPKNRRFYTPTTTEAAEMALAWEFKAACGARTLEGNLALVALFYRPDRQPMDGDNLMKLVLDAGTKAGAWRDDRQVTHQTSVIELDAARPRTVVAMATITGSLDRGRPRRKKKGGADGQGVRKAVP